MTMATQTKPMNSGLVAVSDRNGGFHVYMTGGLWEPSKWLRGQLYGSAWFTSKADLEWAAARDGRKVVRHADYFQLQASGG